MCLYSIYPYIKYTHQLHMSFNDRQRREVKPFFHSTIRSFEAWYHDLTQDVALGRGDSFFYAKCLVPWQVGCVFFCFSEPINDPLPETKQSHLKHQCWMSKFPFWQKASHVRSLSFREMCMLSKPIASVYGILTYMSPKNPPNVGK